ncbi:hypothetical protein DERP_010126 [Dermatophagoides pteronyssinus]|uniref:Uncharacterized protein n=1 Tax=Dermatophagoides pteronyssinus TaxID=6956 RepID=A0ABQ8JFJ3_DERPT|nr:hypothetical protein DERP_010126 [Dermatophagoides pteronyssinus]
MNEKHCLFEKNENNPIFELVRSRHSFVGFLISNQFFRGLQVTMLAFVEEWIKAELVYNG